MFYKKSQFNLPSNSVYLCGHSLGPQSLFAQQQLLEGSQQWACYGAESWNKAQWIHLSRQLGHKIAPLIGAFSDEVIVCDSTSINLFKLLIGALKTQQPKSVILTDNGNFPADLYIAASAKELYISVTVNTTSSEAILESINEQTAIVLLTHVNYRTSQLFDLEAIIEKAHAYGAWTLFDFSHSVGALPLECSHMGVDLAVGCTYKYLNGGPGSPSFLYVNRRHHETIAPGIAGWMGHHMPFDFSSQYKPANGVNRYLCGTPSILSMKALEGALCVFDGLDIYELRKASMALSSKLIELMEENVPAFTCVSSLEAQHRGSHVAFIHPQAYGIVQALIERGIIVDYREPNLVRMGLSPLYNNLEDVQLAVDTLRCIMKKGKQLL